MLIIEVLVTSYQCLCPVAINFTKYEGHSVGPLGDDRPVFLCGSIHLLYLRFRC